LIIYHRFNIKIPQRDDLINRGELTLYSNYDEMIENEFPNRKWTVEEIDNKGRGLICTKPIKQGEIIMKEQATIFYLGEEVEGVTNKDSTYFLVKSSKALETLS